VLNAFDTFFEEHVKNRSDLALRIPPERPDPPFPVACCLAVLRVTALLLENCSNKQLYNSYEARARRRLRLAAAAMGARAAGGSRRKVAAAVALARPPPPPSRQLMRARCAPAPPPPPLVR